ncbi:MAG TPA: DUF1223 domain-containing protein [Burkholderiales bacterium]|nr:DUF1223 domain-containing protein [Burkholderiales bacterium]
MNKLPWFLSLFMSVIATPVSAAVCQAKSGNTTTALLELYTSEGCDSCPPADRWIAGLPSRGVGPDRVVPLALHVDYWNHLGWTDRFSQAAFTQRQRELANRAKSRTIYTPQLVLNGRDYYWTSNRLADDLARTNRRPARADINLQLVRKDWGLAVTGAAALRQTSMDVGLYLALYENDLRTEVRAGENRGRTLEHAFVVHRLIGPLAFDSSGKAPIDETFKLDKTWNPNKLGVAAFVQELKGTEVLQALALRLCP